MEFFELFLQSTAFTLSAVSLVLVYISIKESSESSFVPIYYFLGLSLTGVLVLSLSEMVTTLLGPGTMLSSEMVKDLFLSYIALFLFGTIWQSYEAEMALPSFVDKE